MKPFYISQSGQSPPIVYNGEYLLSGLQQMIENCWEDWQAQDIYSIESKELSDKIKGKDICDLEVEAEVEFLTNYFDIRIIEEFDSESELLFFLEMHKKQEMSVQQVSPTGNSYWEFIYPYQEDLSQIEIDNLNLSDELK